MKLLTRPASILAVALAGLALTASPARAAILAENTTSAPFFNPSTYSVGQSFTVLGSGSFTNISFNFFLNNTSTPLAGATAFLLSSEYLGAPASLSNGTAGYLGSAAASGGFYNFGSSVTLVAGVQYFLYTNAAIGADADVNQSLYAGGNPYAAALPDFPNFSNQGGGGFDHLFRVTGDAVGAPDGGSTALLLALGLAGLGLARRSRRA